MQGGSMGGGADPAAALQAVTDQLMGMQEAEQQLAYALARNAANGASGAQRGGGGRPGQGGGAAGGSAPGGQAAGGAGADGGAAGAQARGQMQQAARGLLQAAQGVAQGMADARGRGQGKGQGKGEGKGKGKGRGKGRGKGQGRGGQGKGTGGTKGRPSGRGGARGPQLKSDQRGGYNEAQLHGEHEEDDEALLRVRRRAKEVADRQQTKRNLEDLGTDEYDAALLAVSRQVRELRVVLEQQEAKDREREWVAHQATGELDDSRLVDGVTGEKLIYRRRIEPDVPLGHQQKKPKRLSFVMDVSASMYRFNGEDGRLDRMTQAVAMLMESLDGFEHKYQWNIVGHSGNGPEISFVEFGQVPRGRVQRAQVMAQMVSASAIAASGDSTIEAIEAAVKRVAAQEADDYLVFVVSDANLGGYGITPEMLRRSLTSDPKVTACAVFIAERDAAEMLSTALPAGRGYVCLDVERCR